jgi:hypothetical protein
MEARECTMARLRRASEVVGAQLQRFRCKGQGCVDGILRRVRTMDVEVSFRALVHKADAAVGHAYCYLQDRDQQECQLIGI